MAGTVTPWPASSACCGSRISLLSTIHRHQCCHLLRPDHFSECRRLLGEYSDPGDEPVGVVNVIFTVVASLIVDKFGRRPLLLWCVAVMTISLVALGTI